jgi:hypothetical protein
VGDKVMTTEDDNKKIADEFFGETSGTMIVEDDNKIFEECIGIPTCPSDARGIEGYDNFFGEMIGMIVIDASKRMKDFNEKGLTFYKRTVHGPNGEIYLFNFTHVDGPKFDLNVLGKQGEAL